MQNRNRKKVTECKPERKWNGCCEKQTKQKRKKRRKKDRKKIEHFNEKKLDLIESLKNWIEFGAKRIIIESVSVRQKSSNSVFILFVVVILLLFLLLLLHLLFVCKAKRKIIATHSIVNKSWCGWACNAEPICFAAKLISTVELSWAELLQIMIRWNRFAHARRWCDCVTLCVYSLPSLSLSLTLSLPILSVHKESVYFWLSWSITSVNSFFVHYLSLTLSLSLSLTL